MNGLTLWNPILEQPYAIPMSPDPKYDPCRKSFLYKFLL